MTDWGEVYNEEAGEHWVSGTVNREELYAEITPQEPRSLFDRRLKSIIRRWLDEAPDGEQIQVEALIRRVEPQE